MPQAKPKRPSTVLSELEQLIHQKEADLYVLTNTREVIRRSICNSCKGFGRFRVEPDDHEDCKHCGGTGYKHTSPPPS